MTTDIHSNNMEGHDMAQKLDAAEILISKWDTNERSEMLFQQSNVEEVKMYISAVKNLQQVMEHLCAGSTKDPDLIHSQRLMKMAMARLQNDFHKILSSNSEPINPVRLWGNSSADEIVTGSVRSSADRIWESHKVPLEAVGYLQNIAQLMAKTGYARECVRVFALPRKSMVEESLYNLGIEKVNLNDVKKMEWKLVEEKIKTWISAAKISIRILFTREKKLCSDVFKGLDKMRDACFAEVVKDCTERIFTLADAVAVTSRAPERIFRVLDLYQVLADLMPDIEDLYSLQSCGSVQEEGKGILVRLGEAARRILAEFEKAIEKEKSKIPIAGGNVHPLTRYVMNYLVFLSDYKETLVHILIKADNEPLNDPSAHLCVLFRWILFRLHCKVERKCNLYKDASLSHLFLRNNLHYVVQKVNGSELKSILGEEWLTKHWKASR